MGDCRGVLLGHRCDEPGNRCELYPYLRCLKAGGQLGEESFHPNSVIDRELHLCVIRVKLRSRSGYTNDPSATILSHLDGPVLLDVVRKIAGVEIALQCTNRQDKFGTFDTLPHFRTADLSNVNLVGDYQW